MQQYTEQVLQLLTEQKEGWPLATKNFAGLEKVRTRAFNFDEVEINVQFNPERIVSSAAKVDAKSIEARPCFLCSANRPKEQRGIVIGSYSVLVNPFPIFPQHFTIVEAEHVPQQIKGRLGDMLELAFSLQGFTLFYNGPKCGASAPDHFHFQAGNRGFMPIEDELEKLKNGASQKLNYLKSDVWAVKDGLRNFLLLESAEKDVLEKDFQKIYENLEAAEEEPMMNILAFYEGGKWKVIVFPRAIHRPAQYFAEGEGNILISPASVDMGGVLITPLEKDFDKITQEDISDIFKQVLYSKSAFNQLIQKLENA
ncbi:DUF4922 domain-containing protein [Maribellus sp. YY47]|uniref:DUF4922 domain-containing protein n=1 Tax=Maribellus sp. YY47 TaxID=2929486 RepID=UPI002001C05F|nr:DUF4922 domain-containing protein [Maribellus sp. YY47]MCK3683420.1 DUF4922 domain-containing protein [Maribellus sp. YY47]